MKNRKMLRNLAALGVVTCIISNNLQIPLKALTEYPYPVQADATTLEVLENLSKDTLHVSLETAITKYEAGSILGKFSITGVNPSAAPLVLEADSKDNHKFAIENNILKSKVDLVPGASYIIEVICMDKSFVFDINIPNEGEKALLEETEEGGSKVEALPGETEEGGSKVEALPAETEEGGSKVEALPAETEEGGSKVEALPAETEEGGNKVEALPGETEKVVVVDKNQLVGVEGENLESVQQAFNKEEVYENAVANYVLVGDDRVFDGTKTIDKTIDKDKIKGLTKGTIIIKAKFNPEMATNNGIYPIIGLGSSQAQETGNTKAQVVGVEKRSNMTPRYEFTDGLYSSCARNVNYADGKWHVLALVFDDANIFVSGDGETTLDPTNGHYADARFNGFLTRNPDMDSITIGGIIGTQSNSSKLPYQNWVGEIAQVTITDQILTTEQANELTLSEKEEILEVTLDGGSVDFGEVGAEVGTFVIKGEGAQTASVTLKEDTADNDKFIVENNVLKTKEALESASTYRVVAMCNGEEFEFIINSKIDTSLPIIQEEGLLSFQNGQVEGGEKNYNNTVVNQIKLLKDMTLKLQFKQNQGGVGSLFSFSDSKNSNIHFHLYANGSDIGYEMRVDGSNDSNSVAKLRSNGVNTVAFKADSQNYTYKLFVNGELVFTKEMTPETYKMASHILGLDTVSLGRTARSSGNTYPYTGLIGEVILESKALSDDELIDYTRQTEAVSQETLVEQPFVARDEFGSNYFRIPALTELKNGDIMAAMDVRFGSTSDSPNNLDTGVRIKRQGSWEEAQIVNHFVDYVDEAGAPTDSASFIDPAVVQDPVSGRIYMLADAFPSGGGLFGNYKNMYGNGMVKISANGQKVADDEEGTYYVGLVPKGTPLRNGMEMTHYLKPIESTNPDVAYEIIEIATNKKTNYTLNEKFEVFKDYKPLTVAQKRSNGSLSGVDVPMSIFYDTSEFLLYPVAHLWLVTSDDNGVTWNAPKLIANEFKTKEMRYFIAGPGRGHIIENGPYAGRILFPMYSDLKGERSSVIYSDDKGETWRHSEITTMTSKPGKSPGKSSEAQLIELPDGTIRMYARSKIYVNYVGYADSLDGGATFEPMQIDEGFQFASNVQLSVINYSRKIDGKPAIILSAPEGEKGSNRRSKGRIHVGLINENPSATGYDKYDIDWKYTYEVNNTSYAYSCLAELPNGDIAVLYEGDGIKPVYEEIPMDRILGKVAKPNVAYINLQGQLVSGQQAELAISTKERVVGSLSDLENSTLDITFEGIEAPETTATFKEISSEGTTIVYTLSLPESSQDYTLQASLNEDSSLVTLDEVLQVENVATLSTTVYTQIPTTTYDIGTGDQVVGGRIHANKSTAIYGDKVEVNVVAEEGFIYKPGSLKVNGIEVINNRFTMPNEEVTLTAEFIKNNYSVTTDSTLAGVVKTSKTVAKEGDIITVIATPNAGYEVEGIRINGTYIEGTTFRMPDRDTSVSAVFKQQDVATYNIYTTQAKNGVIKVDQTKIAEGELVNVQILPDEGYELYQMQVNSTYIEGTTFTMPNHNVTLNAEFVVASEKPQVSMPTLIATGGEADRSRIVRMTTATEGATIYYTIDGTVPTQEGLVYKGEIQVDKAMTIWAIAVKEGMKDSTIATLEIVVTPESEKPEEKPEEKPSIEDSTEDSTSSTTQSKPGYKVETEGTTTTRLTMEVKASVDKNTASLNLSKIVLLEAIEEATKQATKKGTLEKGVIIELVVDTPSQPLSALEIVFPQGVQEQLISKNIQAITFVNDLAHVSLDLEALKEMSATIDDEFIMHLTEVKQSQLSLYTQKLFSGKPVFDLMIKGKNNNKSINILAKGSITMSIPYTLKADESLEYISAVAINGGELVNIEDVTYNKITQRVEVKTPYGTKVAVSYEPPSVFKDASSHWAKNDIEFVTRLGIFGGTKVDQFSPDTAMTRGMFVTVLGRLAQVDSEQYTVASNFKDINTKMYYAPYVNWANSKGISKGINEMTFGAEHQVTREQVAVMIANYLKDNHISMPVTNEEGIFEDYMDISTYAKEAVKQMQRAGILSGKPNDQFNPQGKATRAEIATILKRLISIVENTK